ncbi:cytochrome c [Gemmobacter aquaticus]|jgi:mono/diheme cytochrome c family protein|uniref:Cytochrome c n=1 Tax=Gemmobacter aquaticus TaxID=490185 RepID=A0A917YIR6_9RHOB|nr:cytochrome c [Gemmobacter aquaticus]GGO23673.1 cytochrome c [Gemmobacter aquaticus]
MQLRTLALIASLIPLAACVKSALPEPEPTGAQDFANYCASCHGAGGKGDGPAAAGLDKKPADLTQLAGPDGKIPMTRVMSKIWGYTRAPDGTLMPRFAPLLESDQMVLFDSGDGIPTPTPRRLVQLAEYLQTIQAK